MTLIPATFPCYFFFLSFFSSSPQSFSLCVSDIYYDVYYTCIGLFCASIKLNLLTDTVFFFFFFFFFPLLNLVGHNTVVCECGLLDLCGMVRFKTRADVPLESLHHCKEVIPVEHSSTCLSCNRGPGQAVGCSSV